MNPLRSHAVLAVVLAAALTACAFALVTAQQRSRELFAELERAQQKNKALEADGNRLRVELGRVSQPAAVESSAKQLGLKPIDAAHTAFLSAPPNKPVEAK